VGLSEPLVQGSRFSSIPTTAATTMDPASPAFTPASAFAASTPPVSMFASATVPAENAEPVEKPVDFRAAAQKIHTPAQKKTVSKSSGGGLFDSMYAK
jgi:hypothetical protein